MSTSSSNPIDTATGIDAVATTATEPADTTTAAAPRKRAPRKAPTTARKSASASAPRTAAAPADSASARKTSSTGARATTGRRATATTQAAAASTTSTQPKTTVEQVSELAGRVILVPVGAGLIARDDLVSTVRGLANRYGTRTGVQREIKRYEKRGAAARNRFEKQVRRQRSKFERDLRDRRHRVERIVSSAHGFIR
jgi:cobalamin biosynthesis Mg chelatase CobN